MAQNETNQPIHNSSQTPNQGEHVDIHQNIGAQRRADGSPDTSFDMETGEQNEEWETTATRDAIPGVIADRATTGPLGSGPINIGPGTSGSTYNAGAGNWSRAGGPGTGPTGNPNMPDTTTMDELTQNADELNQETGMANQGVQERDADRRHGVGNRATYMSEEPKK